MRKIVLTLAAAATLMTACNNPAKQTEIRDAQEVQTPTQATEYALDATASSFKWNGRKKLINDQHNGTIDVTEGTLSILDGRLVGGKFVADMTTIRTTDDMKPDKKNNLEGHLRSEAFFDVANHPTAVFEITEVKDSTVGTHRNYLYGNLTVRGVTHNVGFPASINVTDDAVEAQGRMAFDRSKYNVAYGSETLTQAAGDAIISDEIVLEVDLKANRR